MWFQRIFGSFKTRPGPRGEKPEIDVQAICDRSNALVIEHAELLPTYTNSDLFQLTAWFAIPVFIALRTALEPHDPADEEARAAELMADYVMTFSFGEEEAADDDLAEVRASLAPSLRQLLVLWRAVFAEFSLKATLREPRTLRKMLTGLFNNPEFGLAETLHLDDEEILEEFSGAAAEFFCLCYGVFEARV